MTSATTSTSQVLVDALPFIQRFRGQIVVIKFGGNAMDGEVLSQFAADVVLLRTVGIRVVVVHGGGPQISALMAKLGKVPEMRDGLRVTDAETLDIARMVLVGKVNRDLVGAINVHAPWAVGLSGEDARLITAEAGDPALGFVGNVKAMNTTILDRLLAEDLIPVVATIASDGSGQAYNINADTGAAAVAVAVGASKLIYLTDVDGIRSKRDDARSLQRSLTVAGLKMLLESGAVSEGMIPKARGCIHALEAGVSQAHVLDGRLEHSLLLELLTSEGVGTMVTP